MIRTVVMFLGLAFFSFGCGPAQTTEQRRYHQQLPAGYARGLEAVIYIERIRNYHDLLLELAE